MERGIGMSSVKPAKSGKGYYGIVNYYDSNGKRRQKSAGKFKLKREAQQAADELEKQLDTKNLDLAELSMAQYYWRWYGLYKERGVTAVTQNRYKVIGRVIEGYFKDRRLDTIRRSDYQAFINWYGGNHARDSVVKLNGAIRSCVGAAIDDDIITKDFTHNVQLVHDKGRQWQVEYLNADELLKLKRATVDELNHLYTARYMILTAIYTGMRKGEIQALTWKDLDFLHSTINVNKSWDEKEKTFKPTKTTSSNRVIKVNQQLLKRLADLKVNSSTMVFQNVWGTIPTSTGLNKTLRKILNNCGIEKQGFHFHSLRHVHVAYLLGQGVDVYAISKRLGHSNVTITLDTYSYLIDEYRAKSDELIITKLANLD